MWWKRGFIILLSLNILVFVGGLIVLDSFPSATSSSVKKFQSTPDDGKTAAVQVVIGQDAINSYIAYALTQEADVQKIMSYAQIQFASTWNCDIGVKLLDKVVPFHLVLVPDVENGNLNLQVKSASMGQVPVPDSLLFLLLKHLQWPNWINLDANHHILQLNFTQRPQEPFGVRILGYSSTTQQLSLQVTMSPSAIAQSANHA
ncbi:DUF2140 family protein [Alicyclobacillus acidoterrestris]|uniref:YpmS family protein n=1 Tax=Alicyclobacillus acidoterrestris (strain ATCC 49025 / DSM 3922 / CIP 106132 / NCIMB 13137 / GD3B) TaxID=1356854 RepID=T0CUF1_ALIAG|nr:DUF2140 family protein [Alicyclobacillus acidoterrestris]EPZ43002.1 hypothetical protein N007_01290 [Alicyclobacillus acidoterrestris ATCC 49025]UNO49796.1 YpmS family protein [Alicyclobacillus acidoterrestris]